MKCETDTAVSIGFFEGCSSKLSQALVQCSLEYVCNPITIDKVENEQVNVTTKTTYSNSLLFCCCCCGLIFMIYLFRRKFHTNPSAIVLPLPPLEQSMNQNQVKAQDVELPDNDDDLSYEDLDAVVIDDVDDLFHLSSNEKKFITYLAILYQNILHFFQRIYRTSSAKKVHHSSFYATCSCWWRKKTISFFTTSAAAFSSKKSECSL
uniref:Uncharacterized protein n=1 Tax=Aureoumbra lagunensis TaxID=44058 RepID=A0A7S3NPE0_9STRA